MQAGMWQGHKSDLGRDVIAGMQEGLLVGMQTGAALLLCRCVPALFSTRPQETHPPLTAPFRQYGLRSPGTNTLPLHPRGAHVPAEPNPPGAAEGGGRSHYPALAVSEAAGPAVH